MARIEDLINDIQDAKLRGALEQEVKRLKETTEFGLVFERHQPESVVLAASVGIQEGSQVRLRKEPNSKTAHFVKELTAKTATIEDNEGNESKVPISDLLLVKSFDEPIFPTLTPLGSVERGGEDKPSHLAIQADNFHALEQLSYAYEGQIDLIYIDPPYNTGARDWKYNNDYVDKTDKWRHSRWLSFMEKRLRLAKRLLTPNGVLVVTIDEHEVSHLGVLLEEKRLFAAARRQLVTIVNNRKGVTQDGLSRVEEYAYICMLGNAMPVSIGDDLLVMDEEESNYGGSSEELVRPGWRSLLRGGDDASRKDRIHMFYPVLIDPDRNAVVGVGKPLLPKLDSKRKPTQAQDKWPVPDLDAKVDGHTAVWPIRKDGSFGRWSVGADTLKRLIDSGYVALGRKNATRKTWGLSYLTQQHQGDIELGILEVVEFDKKRNLADVAYSEEAQKRIKTVWSRSRHDAGSHGSKLLTDLLGTSKFDYPKSLYAVIDTLNIFVRDNPDAVVLDFFAGSGTTLHATCLINEADGGNRRCLLVTNNEVEDELSADLMKKGSYPGDKPYEAGGIFESITRPRCEAAVNGKRADGTELSTTYPSGRKASEGFDETVEFLRLDYLDPNSVELGMSWDELLPMMWLIAGTIGKPPKKIDEKKGYVVASKCGFAVLTDDERFSDLVEEIGDDESVKHIFLLTDSEDAYAEMTSQLPSRTTHMWPRDYLQFFRKIAEERS